MSFRVPFAAGYDLTLSGHTHGGQLNVELARANLNVARNLHSVNTARPLQPPGRSALCQFGSRHHRGAHEDRRPSRGDADTPVRRLILSDIHANFVALDAVLRHADGAYDEIACCGDLVGYCADPREVIDWAREARPVLVRGNHDRACCGLDDMEWFNGPARAAAHWTMEELDDDARNFLLRLPGGPLRMEDYELVHGSPLDEDAYLLNSASVELIEHSLYRPICFAGHTHLQGGWSWQRGGLQRLPVPGRGAAERIIDLDPDYLYFVNPGSVGQPRDGDPRAAYALWDSEERLLRLRRIRYDVAEAQLRIMNAGLPKSLADRLALGR